MLVGFGAPTKGSAARFSFAVAVLFLAAWPGACASGSANGDGAADPGDAGAASRSAEAGVDASVADAGYAEDAFVRPSPDVLSAFEASGATDAADAGALAAPDAVADVGPDDATPTCTARQILCGNVCVDPTTDPNHCGSCASVCASGVCGTVLAADMTQPPPDWTFNGTAIWDTAGPSARMTAAMTENVAGTVIYNRAIVTDSFDASFQFRVGANGGGQYDGMGFMIELTGPTAVGGVGGGLGMAGLDGFGAELDIYNNGKCGDSNPNHVGVDQLASCSGGQPTSLYASPPLTNVTLYDAQWHTATVQLAAGAMSIAIDSVSVATGVSLTGFSSGTAYYYGFAGAIGGGGSSVGAQTEVKAVTITFPTPRCL